MMTAATAVDLNTSRFNHVEMDNTEWVIVQHQSTAAGSGDDGMLSVYDQTHYLADSYSEEDEDDTILVEQHLDPEQKDYEFPSRALLIELAAVLDTDTHDDVMFDESSFTTMCDNDYADDEFDEYVGSIVSSIQHHHHQRRYSPSPIFSSSSRKNSNASSSPWSLVDDSRLSPLQLPPRDDEASFSRQQHNLSTERRVSTMQHPHPRPVHPSFFLRQEDDDDNSTYPDDVDLHWDRFSLLSSSDSLDLPVFMSESVPIMDDDDDDEDDDDNEAGSFMSYDRHPSVVVLRLSKQTAALFRAAATEAAQGGNGSGISSGNTQQPLPQHRVSEAVPWCQDDEGYNDEATAKEEEDDDEDEDNEELESVSVFLPLTTEELAGMADQDEELRNAAARTIQACWRGYRERKQQKGFVGLVSGLANICTRLHHRQMTRMTERLETLQGRINEERAMRIGFEKAMEEMTVLIDRQQTMLYDRMEQMQTDYDRRIAIETQKRVALEESMNRVLLEMQDMQRQQQRRANEEAEHTRALQKKLDLALQQLKKSTPSQQLRSTTPSSHLLSSSSVRTGTHRLPRTSTATPILDRPSASLRRSTATTKRR